MHMGVTFNDTGWYQINQHLTPFDIKVRRNGQVIQQGLGDRLGEEGKGEEESLTRNAGSSKHYQVALRYPLCSGHPNTGMGGRGGEVMVHCLNQCRHYHGVCI